jgi:hypothetical protein
MDFWQAVQAMDAGRTVRKAVNPERLYRLGEDGHTIVNKPMNGEWACKDPEYGGEWRPAVFFSKDIRDQWQEVRE